MVISLDFEMLWGILDHRDPLDYEQNIKNVPRVVGCLLRLFRKYGIMMAIKYWHTAVKTLYLSLTLIRNSHLPIMDFW